MYSVVLMMALTATTDLPDMGRGGGCGGGGRHHRGGGCCGCYGGGYGGGCYGGGYSYGCGCYGGGYGMSYGGGCYGGGYGMSYGGCYGGVGMSMGGCYGGMGMGMGGFGMPYATPTVTQEQLKNMPKDKGKDEVSVPAPATIIVSLPADAKLTIDNDATAQTSSQRVFVSPTLQPGRDYHYTFEARFEQDGKPVVLKKEVAVRAGIITPVTFSAPASVAQR